MVVVSVGEDGEKDALHEGFVGEDVHLPGWSSRPAEAPLDGVRGAPYLASSWDREDDTGERLVDVLIAGRRGPWGRAVASHTPFLAEFLGT